MKTKQFNIILLLMIPFLALAGDGVKGKYKKEKKINKSYTVSPNVILDVKNKYGNVYVTTWDHNTAALDIVIIVSGNDEDKVTKRLNSINVDIVASKDRVTATTGIGNFNGNNVSMEINYTIKIPKQGGVNINNKYGNIMLGKINGESYLVCKYGDIKIDELNNRKNVLDMEYCGSSTLGYMNSGKVVAKYSNFSLGNGDIIDINSEYTNILLTKIEEATYKCKYGNMNIVTGGKIFGVSSYLPIKIGKITSKLNLTSDYGNINIQFVDPKVNEIYITTTYASTKIGYAENYPFDFEVDLSYGNLQGASGMHCQKKEEKRTSNYYKGYNITSGKNRILIKSEYGDIKFIKS
jgi:hypothetical protein